MTRVDIADLVARVKIVNGNAVTPDLRDLCGTILAALRELERAREVVESGHKVRIATMSGQTAYDELAKFILALGTYDAEVK